MAGGSGNPGSVVPDGWAWCQECHACHPATFIEGHRYRTTGVLGAFIQDGTPSCRDIDPGYFTALKADCDAQDDLETIHRLFDLIHLTDPCREDEEVLRPETAENPPS